MFNATFHTKLMWDISMKQAKRITIPTHSS